MLDQPGGRPLLDRHVPGAGAPQEGPHRHAHQPETDQRGLPAVAVGDLHDLGFGRARRQGNRPAIAATAATDMAVARALHVAQRHQRRAIDRLDANDRMAPFFLVHLEMPGRQLGQQVEHAIDRTQVLAPDALAAAIAPADDHRRHGRAAQHRQRRQRVLIDTDQLAVDRRQGKGHERPAAPAHPARNGAALAALAGPLGEHALGTEPAAPGAPQQRHGNQDERPPHAPERELRQHGQIVEDRRGVVRQGQEHRHDQQERIRSDDAPLQLAQQRGMVAKHVGKAGGRPPEYRCHVKPSCRGAAPGYPQAAERAETAAAPSARRSSSHTTSQ
ncbi:Uncharacterised protein [Bordetella pertussis]|nr:Uncharacterised protein [Bordetella pertussis]